METTINISQSIPMQESELIKLIYNDGLIIWKKMNYKYLMEKFKSDVESESELPNKYLYLGSKGANIWRQVETNYLIGQQGETLLDINFKRIVNQINKLGIRQFDIISLGCGTGKDDKIMLNNLKADYDFHFICVDLSTELLLDAVNEIAQLLKKPKFTRETKVFGVCCDFSELEDAKEIIGYKGYARKQEVALFHLLGLTLANNKEKELLREISKVMHKDDLLLLEVDFSKDEDECLDASEAAYKNELIDNFLCSPILTAAELEFNMKENPNMGNLLFNINKEGNRINFYHNPIGIYHYRINGGGFSDVPNATSFVRQHYIEFVDSTISRICDYSNKYSYKDFQRFLKNLPADIPLKLVPSISVRDFGIKTKSRGFNIPIEDSPRPLQYLVLLQKFEETKEDDLQISRAKTFCKNIKERLIEINLYNNSLVDISFIDKYDYNNKININRIKKNKTKIGDLPQLDEAGPDYKKNVEKFIKFLKENDI